MTSTIERAAANQGVLGSFCNVAMLCKALYGRLPGQLPASLEAVIDGSVKTGLDLTPVKLWNEMAVSRMVRHGQSNPHRAMPNVLLERLPEWLRPQVKVADAHWLDTLADALAAHKGQYWADVEALAGEACPPLALFEQGRDWLPVGKELRQAYGRAMRQVAREGEALAETGENPAALDTVFEAARAASEAFLAQWPADKRHLVLLGAAAYLYVQGPSTCAGRSGGNGEPVRDALLWQLGRKREGETAGRESGIAHLMIDALRQIGLLGEPVWTTAGPVLHYGDEPGSRRAGVPIRINGTWYNWLRATRPDTPPAMSLVPKAQRDLAKARIADFVQDKFRGMTLFTEVTDANRVITRTPQGNLFGYVQKEHELAAVRHDRWRIAWAHVIDGNVCAILEPISA